MIGWLTGSNRQTKQAEGLVLFHALTLIRATGFPQLGRILGRGCRLIGSLRQGDTAQLDGQTKEIFLQAQAVSES